MAKKVEVNKDLCISCGMCAAISADVFAIGDDGKAEVIADVYDDSVQEAADSCPVQAIVIE